MWTKHAEITKPENVVANFELNKIHYALIICGSIAGLQSIYAGHKVMKARKNTFVKNRAIIEEKFGDTHRYL